MESRDIIEPVAAKGKTYCYIVRASYNPVKTTFVTPNSAIQQLGFVVRQKGETINRHAHRQVQRTITGTPEVLIVRSGRCLVDIYSEAKVTLSTHELTAGDVIVLVAGGHGFRMVEDTVLMEVKQGPYVGFDDKELF
jgi:mannose-6-phosphate isomerase-like protein (cupin superfamily)